MATASAKTPATPPFATTRLLLLEADVVAAALATDEAALVVVAGLALVAMVEA